MQDKLIDQSTTLSRRSRNVTGRYLFSSLIFALVSSASAYADSPIAHGLIVKFSEQSRLLINKNQNGSESLSQKLSATAGLDLRIARQMSGQSHVINLSSPLKGDKLDSLISILQKDSSIEFVEPDFPINLFAVPDDYFYDNQWSLHSSSEFPAGMNLPAAWDLNTGESETIVAVVDTGILPQHIDLEGKVLPGYDFIAGFEVGNNPLLEQYPEYMTYFRANDGDGRDSDATDPGDWVDLDDSFAMMSVGSECEIQDSSFHGTSIASVIAANTNHAHGISGINWNARILPARVSGKCGGSRSDMIDAIRWAAGVKDPALPDNPNPAKVINLSLGSANACGFIEQEAINDAWNAGAVLVAAAGNQAANLDLSPVAPASCDNVISVTAVRQDATRSYYSNYGQSVDIAAPGGEDAASDGTPLVVASNRGVTEPVEGSHFKHVAGTSTAAAHVSGVVSLMIGANPELTPHQISELLSQSARTFPETGLFSCDKQTCGEGLVDAHAAVKAAIAGYVEGFEPPLENASSGQTNDDSPVITTGLSGGGAGNISLVSWVLMLLALALKGSSKKTKIRTTSPWKP